MHSRTLTNGLRVLTVPLHDTKAVTVFVFAKVGSRHESRNSNGISHFIEHMMFKGTRRRPQTAIIARELDGVGAQYNAFTSKDWTGYYVKLTHERTELALDLVSDILRNSTFPKAEIERERGAVIEEINMYDDNPLMSIDDLFERHVFGDHPVGWNIAGPREVIKTVSRKTMITYRDKFYHAGNMLVVVAGHLPANINQRIQHYFGPVRRRPRTPAAKPYRVPRGGSSIALKTKTVEQLQIGLGVRAYSYTDRRQPALQLMSTILGGGMSSRLFIKVRERRGLCYSIHTSISPYEDTGAFMIQAGLDKKRLDEALKVIVAELHRLKTTLISATELRRAKDQVRGRMLLGFEDSDALASWYGRQGLFYPKISSPEEALAKLQKVTAKEIQTIAKAIFTPAAMKLAIIGPMKSANHLAAIIKQV